MKVPRYYQVIYDKRYIRIEKYIENKLVISNITDYFILIPVNLKLENEEVINKKIVSYLSIYLNYFMQNFFYNPKAVGFNILLINDIVSLANEEEVIVVVRQSFLHNHPD